MARAARKELSPAGDDLVWREFVKKYKPDPVGFAEDVLGLKLLDWQKTFLKAAAAGKRRISVRAGHGVGKSLVCSVVVVWYMVTHFPLRGVVTAPAAGQLFDVLYPEVKTLFERLPPAIRSLFEIFTDRIELKAAPAEAFVSAKTSSPDRPEAMQGVHKEGGYVLLIFDEASGIPESVYSAAAGSMSGHNALTILIGNPTRNSGTFFSSHHEMKSNWFTMHVSCIGNRLVSEDYINETRNRWGEDSDEYRIKVLGEFPKTYASSLISAETVDAAMNRDIALNLTEPLVFGVDVARFGDDRSVICKRQGNVVFEVKSKRGLDVMQVTGWVMSEAMADNPAEILVDSIGLGSGVADRLREITAGNKRVSFSVRDVNVSETTAMNLGAYRLRDELWLQVRDWLNTRICKLPKDDDLRFELVSTCYTYHSGGQYKIESKEAMKQRMRRSPDLADALCLTFASAGAQVGGRAPKWGKGPLRRQISGIV